MKYAITNMHNKFEGIYNDLPLGRVLLTPDVVFYAEFIEEIIAYYNSMSFEDRIDFHFGSETIFRYDNIPFDELKISLYREGIELEKDYTSNYMYMEGEDGNRLMWIDLYYAPEDYDSDEVMKDIAREINNLMNRDLKEYLNSKND